MSRVINRKNVTILQDLSAADGVFSAQLYLTFKPDTMVVKQITYCSVADPANANKNDYISLIRCSNLNNECIGSIYDGCSITPNHTFDVSNATVNTQWNFAIYDYTNALDVTPYLMEHLRYI